MRFTPTEEGTAMKIKIAFACACLSACSTHVAQESQSVPANLVPLGYTAAECKLVDVSERPAGGYMNWESALDAGSHAQQHAECQHQTQLMPAGVICRDYSGRDLPPERCAAQK